MKRLILYIIFATLITFCFAEIIHISGAVETLDNSEYMPIPIEGATIHIDNVEDDILTNENGHYEVDVNWIWNGPIVITCSKQGFTTVTETLFPSHPYEYVNFILEVEIPTNQIIGNVFYVNDVNENVPIQGAFIQIAGVEECVETDATGNYSIEFVWNWDSAVVICCEHIDYETETYSFFPDENPATVNFEMTPVPGPFTNMIYGYVSDVNSGNPIENALISINSTQETEQTDSSGYYEICFNWNWDSAVVINCSYTGYEQQTISLFPDDYETQVDFYLSTQSSPEPITIQGTVFCSDSSDQPIEGAVLTFGAPGEVPSSATNSQANGTYSASLVWNWYGPIEITCHVPGYYHRIIDYLPTDDIYNYDICMQALPASFEPPIGLTGYLVNNDRVVLDWVEPTTWPLSYPLTYRVYIRENDNQYFHPLESISYSETTYDFTLSMTGDWEADFAVTVFEDSTETTFSNIFHIGYSISTDDEFQITVEPQLSVYPNPFNPTTTIKLDLLEDEQVKANIYNIKGQLIKTLINGRLDKGENNIIWDGIDNNNQSVSSGVYLLKVETHGRSYIRKLSLMK